MEINVELAKKVLSVVDAGLVSGIGVPEPGKMCVEAAVCYAMGLPHSDEPTCVSPALRQLKIRLNDLRWSSNAARAKGLRRLAVAQLGSAGTLDDKVFASKVSVLVIQKYVPLALNAAAKKAKGTHKAALTEAATLCSLDPSIENATKAKEAADAASAAAAAAAAYAYAAASVSAYAAADAAAADAAAAYAAAASVSAYAAASAAYADAAAAAAYAASASAYAAASASAAAADAAYAADAADVKRDSILAEFGEDVVQILIEMRAPGTEFLFLTEDVAA